jgi:hypothetical protein
MGVRTIAMAGVVAAAVTLSGCDLGGAGERQQQAAAADASVRSVAEERAPAGFTLASGGQVRDLTVVPGDNGALSIAYATNAEPRSIIRFYEREARAAGMEPAGTLDAGDVLASNFRRADPRPRKLTVAATEEGGFTNVTLSFDMSQ